MRRSGPKPGPVLSAEETVRAFAGLFRSPIDAIEVVEMLGDMHVSSEPAKLEPVQEITELDLVSALHGARHLDTEGSILTSDQVYVVRPEESKAL